jgi:hypothetical protein
MKRARELIHQELARRVARVKGLKGRRGVKGRWGLIGMGYEELRQVSREFDSTEEVVGECDMCCIRPGFKEA